MFSFYQLQSVCSSCDATWIGQSSWKQNLVYKIRAARDVYVGVYLGDAV